MAIVELTAQRNTTGGAAATSVTFTYPATPTQGNLLIATFSWRGDTTVTGTPSGWSLATNSGNATGLDGAIYYKIAGASEPTVHTWTLAVSNKFAGCASEWSGIVTTAPLDKTNLNNGTGTAGTCGLTGTLSQANELVIAMFSNIDIFTWASHDNGSAEILEKASTGGSTTTRNNLSLATKIVSATTSVNYGATLSSSGTWVSAVATFKADSNVNVALTGQNCNVARGSISSNSSSSLTGSNCNVSIGTLTPLSQYDVALIGQSCSVQQNTLSTINTTPLIGNVVNIRAGYIGLGSRHKRTAPLTGIGHEINGVLASPEALSIYRQSFDEGGSLLTTLAADPRTDTGYPVISSVTETTFATDSTNHNVAMPATLNTGDGIVVIITTDGSATITTPNGWRLLYTRANGTALRGSAYAKVSRGTEGGSTVNFITSAAETGAAQVYRITNWNGTLAGIQVGIDAEVTTGSTFDMPAVTSYWGTAKTVWLAAAHTSTSQTVSSAPTNYTNLIQTSSGASTTNAQVITSRYSTDAPSEDPGIYTMSGSGASKVYNTIAIAPGYVGGGYEHFEITRSSTTLWVGLYTSQPYLTADASIERAVIVLHGSGLDAAEYINVVSKNLIDYLGKVIVLTPFFAEAESDPETGQLFWGNSWSELGRSDPSLAWRISSGEVLDELITSLYSTFTNLTGIVIAGHSAGGQLTNRYSAASADTRNRYLVSAPSSYVYPTNKRTDGAGGWTIPASPSTYNDWKYGLDNLGTTAYVNAIGATNLRNRLFYARVNYLVGANDNNPADTSMDLSADAATQGSTRVERQQLYHDYLLYWDTLEQNNSNTVLSGVTSTININSILGNSSVSLVGNNALLSSGILTPYTETVVQLTGQTLSVVQDSLNKTLSTTISGQSTSVTQSTLNVTNNLNILGQVTVANKGFLGLGIGISGQNISVTQESVLNSNITTQITGQPLVLNKANIVGDVSVGLIGQVVSIAIGSVVATPNKSLSGQSTLTNLGLVSSSTSLSIIGQETQVYEGLVTTTQSSLVALTGQAITVNKGDISTGIANAVPGQSISATQGNILPTQNISIALVGQSLNVTDGLLSKELVNTLSGHSLFINHNTIVGDYSIRLNGQQLAAQISNITPSNSAQLIGQELVVSTGNINKSITRTLSGQPTNISIDFIAGQTTKDISGQNISIAKGSISSAISSPLTGHNTSVITGSIGTLQDGNVSITGQSIIAGQGALNKTLSINLIGQSVSVTQTMPTATLLQPIIGNSVSISNGNISVSNSYLVSLVGQSTSLAQSNITANTTKTLTGQITSLAQSNITAPQSSNAALTGDYISILEGNILSNISVSLSGQFVGLSLGILNSSNNTAVFVNQLVPFNNENVFYSGQVLPSGTVKLIQLRYCENDSFLYFGGKILGGEDPVYANLVTKSDYKSYMGITSNNQDVLIDFLIPKVSNFVKSYCKRTFIDYITSQKVENFNGGVPFFNVEEQPIIDIVSLHYSTDYGQNYQLLEYYTDYIVDNNIIFPIGKSEFPFALRGYKLVYTGGYEPLPPDLTLAIYDLLSYYIKNDAAVNAIKRTNTTTMQIEYITDTALPSNIKRVLDMYVLDYN